MPEIRQIEKPKVWCDGLTNGYYWRNQPRMNMSVARGFSFDAAAKCGVN
jgi:hypothetical protein